MEGPLCILNLKIQFFYLVVLSIFTLILSALLVELSLVRKEIFKCVAVVTVSYRLVNISLLRFKDNYFLMHISDDGISIYMLRSMCVYCLMFFVCLLSVKPRSYEPKLVKNFYLSQHGDVFFY